MLHNIEYKPSCALRDMPTFHVIRPTANEALSEWHDYQLSKVGYILYDTSGRVATYV